MLFKAQQNNNVLALDLKMLSSVLSIHCVLKRTHFVLTVTSRLKFIIFGWNTWKDGIWI